MTHPEPDAAPAPSPSELPGSPAGTGAGPLPDPAIAPIRQEATFLQVVGAVFWSFFGVRKGRHMQQDMAIKPLHVVTVGLLGGLAFVLALIALVSFITRGTP